MKKIYTSSFPRNARNPNSIAICRTISRWVREDLGFNGPHLKTLAPSSTLVFHDRKEQKISDDEYRRRYLQELKRQNLTPESIIDTLPDGAILLCYEPPGKFCHRRILAEWIENEIGFEIPEWLTPEELENCKRHVHQMLVVNDLLIF